MAIFTLENEIEPPAKRTRAHADDGLECERMGDQYMDSGQLVKALWMYLAGIHRFVHDGCYRKFAVHRDAMIADDVVTLSVSDAATTYDDVDAMYCLGSWMTHPAMASAARTVGFGLLRQAALRGHAYAAYAYTASPPSTEEYRIMLTYAALSNCGPALLMLAGHFRYGSQSFDASPFDEAVVWMRVMKVVAATPGTASNAARPRRFFELLREHPHEVAPYGIWSPPLHPLATNETHREMTTFLLIAKRAPFNKDLVRGVLEFVCTRQE